MKLKALKYMRYAGKPVNVGDVFEAKDADVRILKALNRACEYTEAPKRQVAAVFKPIPMPEGYDWKKGRPLESYASESIPDPAVEDGSEKPKRAYKRRDMTAE